MFKKISTLLLACVCLFLFQTHESTEAATKAPIGVKWGNSILIKGQIGKITVLKSVDLYKLENGKLVTVKKLLQGAEYRVYSYKDQNGGIYGLGGGTFVKKNSSIKYETPSKIKRDQLARLLFFDKDILTLAKQGQLKGQPISLAINDLTDVSSYYGTYPDMIDFFNGGRGHLYGNYQYFTNADGKDDVLTAMNWWNDELLIITPQLIINTVGVPTSEGIDEMDGGWYMYYDTGEYVLYFLFSEDDNNLSYILLK